MTFSNTPQRKLFQVNLTSAVPCWQLPCFEVVLRIPYYLAMIKSKKQRRGSQFRKFSCFVYCTYTWQREREWVSGRKKNRRQNRRQSNKHFGLSWHRSMCLYSNINQTKYGWCFCLRLKQIVFQMDRKFFLSDIWPVKFEN